MSSPLDFLISMTLVFFAFSVLVSGVVEVWSAMSSKRGHFLWRGISRIMGNTEEGKALCHELNKHPAIAALRRDDKPETVPSYIPSNVFAAALIDILLARGPATLEKLDLGGAIGHLPDELEFKRILLMIWRREQGDPSRVEAGLATYFDQCMDRVSGWYKRDVQKMSMGFGLVLAILLNVDAVHIASALWQDRELARIVADQGPLEAKQYADKGTDSRVRSLPDEIPAGWPPRWAQELRGRSDQGQFWAHMAGATLGYLLMALSCLIGAPVWYQLLTSLLPLRASGPAPKRSDPKELPPQAPPAFGLPMPYMPTASLSRQPGDKNRLEEKLEFEEKVGELQDLLNVRFSGIFDAETRLAIRHAQTQRGYAPTGELTEVLLERLKTAS